MPKVRLDIIREGDVLSEDVVINEVALFDKGTVLVEKSIQILKALGIKSISIEHREKKKFISIDEVFNNIDIRFSYVENNPLMMNIKHQVKDVIINMRTENGKKSP